MITFYYKKKTHALPDCNIGSYAPWMWFCWSCDLSNFQLKYVVFQSFRMKYFYSSIKFEQCPTCLVTLLHCGTGIPWIYECIHFLTGTCSLHGTNDAYRPGTPSRGTWQYWIWLTVSVLSILIALWYALLSSSLSILYSRRILYTGSGIVPWADWRFTRVGSSLATRFRYWSPLADTLTSAPLSSAVFHKNSCRQNQLMACATVDLMLVFCENLA